MRKSFLCWFTLFICALCGTAIGQSSPGLTYGQVPTAGQWNGYFAAKQDTLGYTPLNQAGGTMTGTLVTTSSTTSKAGLVVSAGIAPLSPTDGQVWLTGSGLYYHAGGITYGPINSGNVSGPGSSTSGHIVVFADNTGKAISDSGKFLPSGVVVGTTDTQTLTNKTIGDALTFNGATSGSISVRATFSASGALILPATATSDVLVGRNTTDTLTNKTFDTAGVGNSLKINGTGITAVSGSGSVALAASPAFSGTPTSTTATAGDNSTQIATTAFVQTAVSAIGSTGFQGFLYGLTLSNSTADASNAVNTAAGAAASSDTSPTIMSLPAALGKTLSSNWSVGGTPASPNGCLDTGSVSATATYHIFLIERPDTQVVDELCSLSASSPTMPTNYTLKRRIGSILRASSVIVPFLQRGDQFLKQTSTTDYTSTSSVSNVLTTFNAPTGITIQPILSAIVATSSGSSFVSIGDGANSTATITLGASGGAGGGGSNVTAGPWTNTSAQLRLTVSSTGTMTSLSISTGGWVDQRGRLF